MKGFITILLLGFFTLSCQQEGDLYYFKELPIDYFSIVTPLVFEKANNKYICNSNRRESFWEQGYLFGNADTSACISINYIEINFDDYLYEKGLDENFISCMAYKGGTISDGTHIFKRDFKIHPNYLMVSTISKFDSSSWPTNDTYYCKSIRMVSSQYQVFVRFNVILDEELSIDAICQYFNRYKMIVNE